MSIDLLGCSRWHQCFQVMQSEYRLLQVIFDEKRKSIYCYQFKNYFRNSMFKKNIVNTYTTCHNDAGNGQKMHISVKNIQSAYIKIAINFSQS